MGQPDVAGEIDARVAFEALVREVRLRVEGKLAELFDLRAAEATPHGADVAAMVSSVRELTLRGGKRLRAALVLAAFRATRGSGDEAAAIEIGVALELLQTYLLIHDDWMDGDLVRRGGPSVHALLRAHFGTHLRGDSAAILAGDYASALAQETIANVGVPSARLGGVLRRFVAIQRDAVYGQLLDVASHPADVEAMHALKTGSYTVRGPLLLGAALSGADAAAEAALTRFADPLGVAFQLRDDVLGTFGVAAETGKPFGTDLRAGKRTALVAEAEPRLDPAGRAAFARAFGVADASESEVRGATEAILRSGARAAVERRIDALVATARAALAEAPFTPLGAHLLAGASATLTARPS